MNKKPNQDVWVYRMCVMALGLVMLSSVVGAMILSVNGQNPPQMVITMGAAAAGSLAGLLVPSPLGK